jgi:hypothetical protein
MLHGSQGLTLQCTNTNRHTGIQWHNSLTRNMVCIGTRGQCKAASTPSALLQGLQHVYKCSHSDQTWQDTSILCCITHWLSEPTSPL